MKRMIGIALLAITGMFATGCTEPISAYQDPNAPLQVTVSDYWLRQQLKVTVPRPERIGAGQLKVTVQAYNTTDSDLLVQYKYWFTDKNGVQVDNIDASWESERIAPRGYKQVTFTSLSAAAEDFRVQFRPAK